MLYRALLRFFAKREGKIHSNFDKQKLFNLAPIQHKVVLLVLRTVFAVLITQFFATEALGKNTLNLQIGDSPPSVVLYLCVNFHKCVSVAF